MPGGEHDRDIESCLQEALDDQENETGGMEVARIDEDLSENLDHSSSSPSDGDDDMVDGERDGIINQTKSASREATDQSGQHTKDLSRQGMEVDHVPEKGQDELEDETAKDRSRESDENLELKLSIRSREGKDRDDDQDEMLNESLGEGNDNDEGCKPGRQLERGQRDRVKTCDSCQHQKDNGQDNLRDDTAARIGEEDQLLEKADDGGNRLEHQIDSGVRRMRTDIASHEQVEMSISFPTVNNGANNGASKRHISPDETTAVELQSQKNNGESGLAHIKENYATDEVLRDVFGSDEEGTDRKGEDGSQLNPNVFPEWHMSAEHISTAFEPYRFLSWRDVMMNGPAVSYAFHTLDSSTEIFVCSDTMVVTYIIEGSPTFRGDWVRAHPRLTSCRIGPAHRTDWFIMPLHVTRKSSAAHWELVAIGGLRSALEQVLSNGSDTQDGNNIRHEHMTVLCFDSLKIGLPAAYVKAVDTFIWGVLRHGYYVTMGVDAEGSSSKLIRAVVREYMSRLVIIRGPQQNNSVSCGAYMTTTASYLCKSRHLEGVMKQILEDDNFSKSAMKRPSTRSTPRKTIIVMDSLYDEDEAESVMSEMGSLIKNFALVSFSLLSSS